MSEEQKRARNISIHSLVKRETVAGKIIAGNNFLISIHSLVKRETVKYCGQRPLTGYFNPLPRKEGDRNRNASGIGKTDFNPLPRKEGDRAKIRFFHLFFSISIHSLVKRETQAQAAASLFGRISIHSLVKRETALLFTLKIMSLFQSTPS